MTVTVLTYLRFIVDAFINHLEDLGVDARVILKSIFKWDGVMDWIGLARDRDRRRPL
jgi:hypothetical protein